VAEEQEGKGGVLSEGSADLGDDTHSLVRKRSSMRAAGKGA